MTDKVRLTTSITRSLRTQLEEAREARGRSLTDEVEARLRDSLGVRHTDNLMLLRVDDGLMAWLRAVDGLKFFGVNIEETTMYLLRSAVLELCDHKGEPSIWWRDIIDNLPEPWRSNCQDTPAYRRVAER